ncbi:MAG: hypothetical protein AB1938_15885 [Myxococcota bacterium]
MKAQLDQYYKREPPDGPGDRDDTVLRSSGAPGKVNPGTLTFAGGGGLVFKGSATRRWTDLSDSGVSKETVWDAVEFKGKVYLAAYRRLLVTDGGKVSEVKVPFQDARFMKLAANRNQLWAVGDDFILQFDGSHWKRLVSPDN